MGYIFKNGMFFVKAIIKALFYSKFMVFIIGENNVGIDSCKTW